MWWWATKQDEVKLGSISLQGKAKMLVLTSITGLVVFIFAGTTIFFLVGICASPVLGHAVFHNLPAIEELAEDSSELQSMNTSAV